MDDLISKERSDFFEEGYLEIYPDVRKFRAGPWQHYVQHGKSEGRCNGEVPPSHIFSESGYLLLYPDVAKFKPNPWHHYVLHGKNEGRSNGVTPPVDKFDSDVYLFLYPDIKLKKINPWLHYVNFGKKEGRIYENVIQRKRTSYSLDRPKILLISHQLTLTGAPLSLKGIAEILISNNYDVEIWTFPVINEKNVFSDLDCDIFAVPRIVDNFDNLATILSSFCCVICNTITTVSYVNFMNINGINHIWIIREGYGIFKWLKDNNYDESILQNDRSNIFVVSEYVKNLIFENLGVNVRVIHNFVDDVYDKYRFRKSPTDPIVFTYCGTLEFRKGIDICIYAFLRLPIYLRDKFILNIVGKLSTETKDVWEYLKNITNSYDNIVWHGSLYGDDKWELFSKTDVFLVPSLDEACSRVVLEAAMLSKTFIITRNVGAKYLAHNNAGFVIDENSVISLYYALLKIFKCDKNEIYNHGIIARKNYLKTSTRNVFEKSFLKIIKRSVKTISDFRKQVDNFFIKSYKRIANDRQFFYDVNLIKNEINRSVNVVSCVDYKIAVIIPVYNGLQHLKRLIPSLFNNSELGVKFVFVNDCSQSQTTDYIKGVIQDRNDCLYIENEINLGYPSSINKGVSIVSDYDYFIFLNSDTEVPKHWVSRLIKPFINDEKVASATPLSSAATIFSFPIISSDNANNTFLSMIGIDLIDLFCQNYGDSSTFYEVPCAHGFCMAVSSKVWNEIGGFNFYLYGKGYGEEVDWSRRAHDLGYKNVAVTNLFVAHYHGGSFDTQTRSTNLRKSDILIHNLYRDFKSDLRKFMDNYPLKSAISSIFMNLTLNLDYPGYVFISHDSVCNCYKVKIKCIDIIFFIRYLNLETSCKLIAANSLKLKFYLDDSIFIKYRCRMLISSCFDSSKPLLHIVPSLSGNGIPAGSGYVRCVLPWTSSSVNSHFNLSVSYYFTNRLPSLSKVVPNSVCILQRECRGLSLDEISYFAKEWKNRHSYIFYDLDDDFFAVQELAQKACISIEEATERCERTKAIISFADVILVSTDALKQKVYQFCGSDLNIIVFKNCLDNELWFSNYNSCNRKFNTSKPIKVGYMGTSSHLDDMEMITNAVQRITDEYGDNVVFEVVGVGNNIPWGISVKPDFSSYPNFSKWLRSYSSNWDIAIIPLRNTVFNAGKSNLKFLEFAACFLPIIVSNVSIYHDVAVNNINCLLVDNDEDLWYDALKKLIQDSSLRDYLARNAYNAILKDFSSDSQTAQVTRMIYNISHS